VPIGYLVTAALVAIGTFFALAPPRLPSALGRLSSIVGLVVNELPFVAFYWLLASTLLAIGQGDIDSPGGWVGLGLGLIAIGLIPAMVITRRRPQDMGLLPDGDPVDDGVPCRRLHPAVRREDPETRDRCAESHQNR